MQGEVADCIKEWLLRKRRQHAPVSSGCRGAQGPVPQRAPIRQPGPLVQAVPIIGAAMGVGSTGEEETVDIASMLC